MSLPPNWQRYTTDEGKEYFHNASTNTTQWSRPEWPQANSLAEISLDSTPSDVFQYKPSAHDFEASTRQTSLDGRGQALDDIFGASAMSAGNDLVSLKDAPSGQIGSMSSSGGGSLGGVAGQTSSAGTGSSGEDAGTAGWAGWLLTSAQNLFDVSTDDVLRRLKLVLPYPPPDGTAAEELRSRPDFYGPFWIATTAVLFLAATGNFARLLESEHPLHFKADYGLVPIAATMIYGGLIAVPVVARASLFFTSEEVASVDFKQMICVCGYALSPAIPVSILCIIPFGLLRWVFVLAGLGLSLQFLRSNLISNISVNVRWLQILLVASPIVLQVAIFFVYRVHFFSGVRN
eukprot:TRINITY_DN51494_c0_g1_i1.p1 TRINITY_DN51494_c0_g1~~TRINITY_DN51494_c0_g1_i1.p1  ORF type:complete len:347 (-),score=66.43 TRINITY_DN51494_c0_g1_i1:66-1106(-)